MHNIRNHIVLVICVNLFSLLLVGQDNKEGDYTRFIDSADNYIDESSIKAQSFLDSIPTPLEVNIEGRVSEYYALKVLIQDDFKEYSKTFESHLLALKYGEKEENYRIAGESSLELFSSLYFSKRDSTAYKYLEKAEYYYSLCEYEYGLIEISQIHEYVKFLDGEYQACNDLILENFTRYKNITEDAYFYMFALYMLTSNYVYLEDPQNAHVYFTEFKRLKNNPTIAQYNYLSFEVAINMCFADVNLEKKELDSTIVYLDKSSKSRNFMGGDVISDYFKLSADYYEMIGEVEYSKNYLDSLTQFESKMLKNAEDANLKIAEKLQEVESDLELETNKKYFNGVLLVFMVLALLLLSLIYLIYYKKNKLKLKEVKSEIDDFSYLKTNNEKLALKVHGFEEFISNLKTEVKNIAVINEVSIQREKITELYKKLHHNSSTLLDKSENHLEIINNLNIDFFKQIHDRYPQLNDSEIIICYYLYIGFKNKEIAVFINVSVRAIESKRYRIGKKINLNKEGTTLVKHLKSTFK